jgi:hypothetical protein
MAFYSALLSFLPFNSVYIPVLCHNEVSDLFFQFFISDNWLILQSRQHRHGPRALGPARRSCLRYQARICRLRSRNRGNSCWISGL